MYFCSDFFLNHQIPVNVTHGAFKTPPVCVLTPSLPSSAGHRGDDEHGPERAARAGAAEFGQARPWRGTGHPGAAAELGRGSHAGQLQRVAQPHPRRHAEVGRQQRAAHPPQHQLLQRHHEHLQAGRGAAHGGAAAAPRPEAQTHGDAQVGPAAAAVTASGLPGQVLHHVTPPTSP